MLVGHRTSHGICLAISDFSYEDLVLLIRIFNQLYGISPSIRATKNSSKQTIFIEKKDFVIIKNIVKPYIVPELEYKIRK